MTPQEKVNALGKHFENFNERMETDPLFGSVMVSLVEGHHDVYSVINTLLEQNVSLINKMEK